MREITGERELTFTVNSGETVCVKYDGYRRFTVLNNTSGNLKISGTGDFTTKYFIIPVGSAYCDYIPNPQSKAERKSSIFISPTDSGTVCITAD